MRLDWSIFKLSSSGQVFVIFAMLLLLVVLAGLQYRWLGQLSAGEQEQMKTHLQSVLARFSEDLDNEITHVYSTFSLDFEDANIGENEKLTRCSGRYERWLKQAAHPEMIRKIYVALMDDQGRLKLFALKPEGLTFEETEWPSWMIRLREHMEGSPDRRGFGPPPDRGPMPLVEEPPALVIRMHAPPRPEFRDRTQGPPRPPGFVAVELDLSYLQHSLLPSLVKKHFGADDGNAYAIRVVSRNEPHRVIFASTPSSDVETGNLSRGSESSIPDVAGFAFGLRPGEPRRPGSMRGSDWEGSVRTNRPPPGPPPPRRMQGPGPPFPGLWQVEVRHQEGSLAAAVTRVRRRNLFVSFGILALLAASAVLVIASARQARRLARQQMDFVAGVSHELRTPLAVIESAGYNLDKGVVKTSEQTRSYGALIRKESLRLKEMVEQMLEFAGAQSGRSQYNLRLTSPNEILDEVFSISQPLLVERNFQLESDIEVDLPQVSADGPAVVRAILNLINNAMKYSGESRWIGLQARRIGKGADSIVKFTVADRGVGIRSDELKHIFDPFYRGREARAAQVHGNGLGLSLVKQIVTAHGGAVVARNSPDGGTVVDIDLPVASGSLDVGKERSDVVDELRYEQAHPIDRR